MPCMKCSNGKWKYGEHGNCQFDTLSACNAAAAAIHIGDKAMNPSLIPAADPMGQMPSNINPTKPVNQPNSGTTLSDDGDNMDMGMPQPSAWHDPMCSCSMCMSYRM